MGKNKDKKLGVQIGEVYCDVMGQLMKMLKSRPDVEKIKPKILELQEKTIRQLVELGKIREELDDGAKMVANSDILYEMSNITMDDFKAFSAAVNDYRPLDNDLANIISEFNTITQYADFDLLKKQKPKEFERLGL